MIERASQAGAAIGAVLGAASFAALSGTTAIALYLLASGVGLIIGFIAGMISGVVGTLLALLATEFSPRLERPAVLFGGLGTAACLAIAVTAGGPPTASPWLTGAALALAVLSGCYVLREERQ